MQILGTQFTNKLVIAKHSLNNESHRKNCIDIYYLIHHYILLPSDIIFLAFQFMLSCLRIVFFFLNQRISPLFLHRLTNKSGVALKGNGEGNFSNGYNFVYFSWKRVTREQIILIHGQQLKVWLNNKEGVVNKRIRGWLRRRIGEECRISLLRWAQYVRILMYHVIFHHLYNNQVYQITHHVDVTPFSSGLSQ